MLKFGEYIKSKRLEKGISLRELASKVGISPSYMSDIEKGRRNAPNKEKVDKIAEALFYSEEEINELYGNLENLSLFVVLTFYMDFQYPALLQKYSCSPSYW